MKNKIIAVAYFNENSVKGTVYFTELNKKEIKIDIDLILNSKNSKHGFHIHEAGDLTSNCISMCAHLNPYNSSHGGRNSKVRHVGDLGNIVTDKTGRIKESFIDNKIKLRGYKCNIIGRGLIIHANEDDCGVTSHPDSKTTGNSGARIACSIVGYSEKMFK
jgi:Cu-Zn family superoxide dismutase